MTTASQPDLNQLVNEFLVNGFVVFEELIPLALIDAIYAQSRPLMDRVEGWNSTQLKGDRETGQGRVTQKQRFKIYPPFNGPSADPIIMENPLVLEFLERIWGNDDIELTSYSSNCPAPGTLFQNWHRDGMLMAANLALPVYPCLSLQFPLVDTSKENGSFEVIPCTQYIADEDLRSDLDAILGVGENSRGHYYPIRLNLKKVRSGSRTAAPSTAAPPIARIARAMNFVWRFASPGYSATGCTSTPKITFRRICGKASRTTPARCCAGSALKISEKEFMPKPKSAHPPSASLYPEGGPGRQLKARLKAGEVLVGGMVAEYVRPSIMKFYQQAGFDFVYIEYEHAYFNPSALADTVLAGRDSGVP